MINTAFELLVGHAFADFAAQPTTMAKGKNRNTKPDYIPRGQEYTPTWFYWLSAHSLIHGGFVYLILGLPFGVLETCLHFGIDFLKCENKLTPHQDQLLHLSCKLAYVLILVGS